MSRTHEDCLLDVSSRVLVALIAKAGTTVPSTLVPRAVDLAVALLDEVEARMRGRQ